MWDADFENEEETKKSGGGEQDSDGFGDWGDFDVGADNNHDDDNQFTKEELLESSQDDGFGDFGDFQE